MDFQVSLMPWLSLIHISTGKFNTASLIGLELAEVEGEVNTFKGRELYAFSLKLNAMDLFETEAELALVRSKKDGSLLPDNLWFYVKASPGIVLIPPIPVGQLNGCLLYTSRCV